MTLMFRILTLGQGAEIASHDNITLFSFLHQRCRTRLYIDEALVQALCGVGQHAFMWRNYQRHCVHLYQPIDWPLVYSPRNRKTMEPCGIDVGRERSACCKVLMTGFGRSQAPRRHEAVQLLQHRSNNKNALMHRMCNVSYY